jgi:hypothetical protein
MAMTWEKFGCRAKPASTRRSTRSGSPSVMPQPVLWVSATTPSTIGVSASGSGPSTKGLRVKLRATRSATWAEQFTLVMMPM